ncbi:MAG: dipeptidase [Caldicoprobacter oshimai]|uniref:Dipeptidase. Metallo peptidase. MEROPS family M19 n=1 Tax=Caldicoprobacter faecalis TaxID=937334 RepID=A0A1I5RSU0_9FIRM|nr:dipeptidase [Caldicoprobacter faecalis]PZN11730.1 MAG: membrane dipeptidase [Caldicoprobacter oshimai]SFP61578.1 dipeptidase. Metallo peptidase. MEROPS family M19 [Caldicoprobacter faecalis]
MYSQFFVIDGHCDTISKLDDVNALECPNNNHVSLSRLYEGRVGIQFFAVWIDPLSTDKCLHSGLQLIDRYKRMLDTYAAHFHPILRLADAKDALEAGKIGALLTVEGGDVLEGSLSNLEVLYKAGVRLLTLTWNHSNQIAGAAMDAHSRYGLTPFGTEVVKTMNDLGMIVDVSHASEEAFWDVMEISKQPVIASHSNAKAVCPHPRNLDDEQIKAIASKGGVIGINFYPLFLSKTEDAGIVDIIKHIEYIASLVGTDCIAFGSDFDGIETLPQGIEGPQSFPIIVEELLKLNYSEEDVHKICHNNFLRVMEKILK